MTTVASTGQQNVAEQGLRGQAMARLVQRMAMTEATAGYLGLRQARRRRQLPRPARGEGRDLRPHRARPVEEELCRRQQGVDHRAQGRGAEEVVDGAHAQVHGDGAHIEMDALDLARTLRHDDHQVEVAARPRLIGAPPPVADDAEDARVALEPGDEIAQVLQGSGDHQEAPPPGQAPTDTTGSASCRAPLSGVRGWRSYGRVVTLCHCASSSSHNSSWGEA